MQDQGLADLVSGEGPLSVIQVGRVKVRGREENGEKLKVKSGKETVFANIRKLEGFCKYPKK